MGYVRKRANGQLAFVFSWKGTRHTKGLGTTDEGEAEAIRKEANEQLDRIRRGESALASQLLADGHSIMDVLFGSEKIAHLIASPADDNPLTLVRTQDRLHGLPDGDRSNRRSRRRHPDSP
jgi:hypothetical protein